MAEPFEVLAQHLACVRIVVYDQEVGHGQMIPAGGVLVEPCSWDEVRDLKRNRGGPAGGTAPDRGRGEHFAQGSSPAPVVSTGQRGGLTCVEDRARPGGA